MAGSLLALRSYISSIIVVFFFFTISGCFKFKSYYGLYMHFSVHHHFVWNNNYLRQNQETCHIVYYINLVSIFLIVKFFHMCKLYFWSYNIISFYMKFCFYHITFLNMWIVINSFYSLIDSITELFKSDYINFICITMI